MKPYTTILVAAIIFGCESPRLADAVELQPYSHVYSVTASVG